MKNLISRITTINSAVFFTALFITVFILSQVFNSKNIDLESLDKLIISQATADGISIKGRVSLFYNVLFAGIGLWLVQVILLSFVFQKLKINLQQRSSILLISTIGIFAIFIGLIGVHSEFLIGLLVILLIYKICAFGIGNSGIKDLKPFKTDILSTVVLAFGFLIYFAILHFTGTNSFLLIYVIILLFLTLLFIGIQKITKLRLRRIIQLAVPISFLTFISFISIEIVIFNLLEGKDVLGYKKIFLILLFITSIITLIPFVFRRIKGLNASRIFKLFLAPSILFGFSLLLYYFPVVNQNTEMFELANPANALMKIFQQHEIPFVDFMSSHLFSEQWYGIIYSSLFGYNSNLDFQIYSFLNFFIYFLVAYFTLNKLLRKPAFSILFILSFPFLFSVLSYNLLLAFVPFLLLYNTFKQQTIQNYLGFCTMLIGLCIWRLDVGYAAILSSLFYFLVVVLFTKQKIQWKVILKSIFIIAISVISLLLLVILLRDYNYILNNIKVALDYFGADQAHGLTNIAQAYPHQFYITHFLLPFFSILSIGYIIYLLLKENELEFSRGNFLLHSSLFLFFISLANAPRGLVRHGFAETNDIMLVTTFHIAVVILLLYIFKNHISKWKTTFFYASCFLFFLVLKFFPFAPEFTLVDAAIKNNSYSSLNAELAIKTDIKRTKIDATFHAENIADFKTFLDQNLKKDETFLDFSNTPMLYYYTNRKSPGYFCQNLQNTVDDYLQLSFIKELKKNKIPIVVFSSAPASWFDHTDGIPNAMRYYLVAEHIYKNYKPFKIISNKRIWIKKDFKISEENQINSARYQLDTLSNQAVVYDYKKTAFYLYDFYKRSNFQDLRKVQELKLNNEHQISIKAIKEIPHQAYLLIELGTASNDALLSLTALDSLNNEIDMFKFDVINKRDNQYLIRISNSYHWHTGKMQKLQFGNYTGNKLPTIKKVTLLKDLRNED
jgi:hypothetical protein